MKEFKVIVKTLIMNLGYVAKDCSNEDSAFTKAMNYAHECGINLEDVLEVVVIPSQE